MQSFSFSLLPFIWLCSFCLLFFSLVKSCERDGRRLVDASPLLARSAPERRAGRAANQSKNATQEWENFPFIPRKRAKARSLRIYLSNEQHLFASTSRTNNISSPQILCATHQNFLFEIILLNRGVQVPILIPNRV